MNDKPIVKLYLPAYVSMGVASQYDGKVARLVTSYDTGDLVVEVEGQRYLVSPYEVRT